jgi:NHL repeat
LISEARQGPRRYLAALLFLAPLISGLLLASTASADFVVGAPGSGAGQYEEPQGVAVDTSNGHAYVVDTKANRIEVFGEDGAFLFAFGWGVNAAAPEEKLQTCTSATGCLPGIPGPNAGQLKRAVSIAVDSSSHAVYVGESTEVGNGRVQKFDGAGNFLWTVGGGVDSSTHANLCTLAANCGAGEEAKKEAGKEEGRFFRATDLPLAVGPGGTLYVADGRQIDSAQLEYDTRIQRFAPSGAYIGPQLLLSNTVAGLRQPVSLAVDFVENFYVANNGDGSIYKYSAAGALDASWGEAGRVDPGPNGSSGLTLGPGGSLFAGHFSNSASEVLEFSPTGIKIKALFPAGLSRLVTGLAYYHGPSGDFFAADGISLQRFFLPDPGPLFVPDSLRAIDVGSVNATFEVDFNSEGKASTAHFEYVDKASFDSEGGFASPNTNTTPESAPTTADFENHTIEATNVCTATNPTAPTCLEPETTYRLRAKAKNADGEVTSEETEFTTLPALQIIATWATEVGTDSARLHAEVNPLGFAAVGRFEYVDDAHFQSEGGFASPQTRTTGAINFGSGQAPAIRASQLPSLDPAITYHYRLVAENAFFPPKESSPRSFRTLSLPGGTDCVGNETFRTGPSAALPDCRAYEMVSPVDKSNGDIISRLNVTGFPTNLNQSSNTGSGFTYSSYRAFDNPQAAPYTNQYLAVRHGRGEPVEGWQTENINPPRGPLFRLELESPYKAFTADLSSSWLRQESEPTLDPCAPAGYASLYHRAASGAYRVLSCDPPASGRSPITYMPELQGASGDGTKAVFRIDEALDSSPAASGATTGTGGATRPIYQIYESTGAGPLRLVSALPSGEASKVDSSVGSSLNDDVVNHNRLQSVLGAVSEDGTRVFWSTGLARGPIYLRVNSNQGQSKVEGGECTQPARACTIPVSETKSKDPAFFQAGNPEGTKALFTIEAGPLNGNLYRFDSETDPPSSELVAEKMLPESNILGASRDLTRVYYASEAASGTQQAEGAIDGEPNIYLAEAGVPTRFVGTLSDGDMSNPYGQPTTKRVIERMARVSSDGRSLVFMSNSPALSEEVAGYDNTDAVSGKADAEVYLYDSTAGGGAGELHCVSCNPSGARPHGRELQGLNLTLPGQNGWAAAAIPRFYTQFQQPRYLSEDGNRVFFNSFDSLVLADTNGSADVYQWEAVNWGTCRQGSPAYVSDSEGCLSLVSSGQSPFDSEFLDADPDGSDVFFTTAESLLPQDPGLVDVYDARIGGGFPPAPGQTAACEGESCQSPPAAPNDPTPASASGEYAGNVKATAKACRKGKIRRKGRCVAKRHQKKAGHKARHTNHDRRVSR